jgi:hypothetical protein
MHYPGEAAVSAEDVTPADDHDCDPDAKGAHFPELPAEGVHGTGSSP